MNKIDNIDLKKRYGQHFLKDEDIIDEIVSTIDINGNQIFEIGCGNGNLTKAILKKNIDKLWVFEIDKDWAYYVSKKYNDLKLKVHNIDILDVDFSIFKNGKPWIILANIPYNITFSILYKLLENRDILQEGIIMIQEEVAQKLVKSKGKNYGFNSLYFQHHFDLKLLNKISPKAFYPEPKVYSRLLYLKPVYKDKIYKEKDFWKFIKQSFLQPRRTLKNNLLSYHYDLSILNNDILNLRAQQLDFNELVDIWNQINRL
jgi:16S rRNA (adenine1518-N6/adenine1519-N6)-dimethyltransferase